MGNSIIVFVKNPRPGKVKTRLAATIGDDKALAVYLDMLKHTLNETRKVEADTYIYFSEETDISIGNNILPSRKAVQSGKDLGEKMKNAFSEVLNSSGGKVIITGTDCPGINAEILQTAFNLLSGADIVIGPAADGGYYLLGMKALHPQLFQSVEWSSSSVFQTTINRCIENKLDYKLLDMLHDVDEEKNLVHYYKLLKQQQHD
jgi:uncharacterized protein